MYSYSPQKRFLCLLTGIALAFCLTAGPAHAKKHTNDDTTEKGGLFQAPAAIAKPNLVLDTSIPKTTNRTGDALRQSSPDVEAPAPAAPSAAAAPASASSAERAPASGIVPVRAYEPTRSIESMRVHSLFE
jgi:hypothetical protein